MAEADIKPVYVLHGRDGFLLDQHRRRIVAQAVGDADPQTCVTVLDATAELAEVLDELRTTPFLAPRRVVIVRDADAFVSAYRQQLEEYLQAPASTGTLILSVISEAKTTRLYKLIAKIGEHVDCSAPAGRELTGRLRQAAEQRGKQLAPAAAELMLQWVGNDMASLDGEIEKLSLYVGDRKTITIEDVSELVASTAGAGSFALTNAITDGDAPAALDALARTLTQRGEEFRTLGMIAWHLRRVQQAHQFIAGGMPVDRAVARINMPRSRQRPFAQMLRRRPLPRVQSDFRKLIHADLAMKSGADAAAALQQLVVSLCS